MDKDQRKRGEYLLKKWGEGKKRIEEIQKEINLLKSNINPLINEKFTENQSEIKVIYEKIMLEHLNQMYSQMQEFKKLNSILSQCSSVERNVITQRYVKGHSWVKIAMENYVAKTSCFNIRNKIINKLID